MTKVLIADEDSANVANFKTFLKASFPEIKSIATTSNVNRDLAVTIDKEKSQIIVADIHFFGVSPLTKIKDIYKKHANIAMILYGNYSDAQYLERVMTFGMAEYMFRPVKPKEFHRCMSTALNHIDKLREQKERELRLKQKVKENADIFENTFLTTLINGHITNESEILKTFSNYNLNFGNNFTIIKVKIDRYRKVIENLDEHEKHMMIYKVKNMVDVVLQHNKIKNKTIFDGLNSVVAIASGADNLPRVIDMLDGLKNEIFNVMKIKVTIGIGRTYQSPVDIGLSYKEADAALRYRFSMGYNTVIPIHFVEPVNNITFRYPREREERLVYMAVIGEYEYCRSLLTTIIDALRKSLPLPEGLISKIVMNILISINRYVCEQNILDSDKFTKYFPTTEALKLKSLDEAFLYMDANLKKFCEFTLENRKEKDRSILENTKSYINEKYYENVSLSKSAMVQNTTPEYLNLLFMENEHLTYAEFAMKTRMEKSMKMLRDTNFDDEIISVKIGYDDVKHFRASFKNYYDISTIDYRTKVKMKG